MKTNDKGEYDKYWASNSVNNDIGKGQVKLDSNGQMKVMTSTVLYKSTVPAAGGSGYFMVMQNDGRLVIYDSSNNPGWASSSPVNVNYFTLKTTLIPNTV